MTSVSSFDVGAQTILGCPISSYISLESVCSATAVPSCLAATSVVYDSACCGALTSYAYSLESCLIKNAPACLDTSAALSSLSGAATGSISNPCSAYAGAITTGAATLSSASSAESSASAAGSSSAASAAASTTAASAGSSASAAGSSATAAGSSASSAAGSSATASASGKSDAPKVGAGLKVYITVALVGALAVLAL